MNITLVSYYKISSQLDSGGVFRTYNLFKNSNVSIVGYGVGDNTEEHINTFTQQSISKSSIHKLVAKIVCWLNGNNESSHIVSSLFCRTDRPFIKALEKYAKHSNVLIAEFPYQFSLLLKYTNKLLIYDAHNVEYLIQKDLLSNNFIGTILKKYVKKIEKQACVKADIIFTCSESDKKNICSLYQVSDKKVFVIPNGVDTKHIDVISNKKKIELKERNNVTKKDIVLFIGSKHKPNLGAVDFVVNTLAPLLPEKTFIVIGSTIKSFLDDKPVGDTFRYEDFIVLKNGVSACGLHEKEHWSDGLCVRWSRKNFAINISGKVSRFSIKMKCPKKITGTVFVNKEKIKTFEVSKKWTVLEFAIKNTENPLIHIKLDDSWKTIGDCRELGVVISGIMFVANGKEYHVKKDDLEGLGFVKENIIFLENFDENLKKKLLALSDVAINPVIIGSGTNLKMFEYMAAGLPVVTTPKGARGIFGNFFIKCERDKFKENIEKLFNNKNLYQKIKSEARNFVEEEYNWNDISSRMLKIIENNLKK